MSKPGHSNPLPDGLLAAYLADRDAPCPGCGYNLRGCTTGHCPECGIEINLTVAREVIPSLVPWLLCVAPCAFSGIFAIILLCDGGALWAITFEQLRFIVPFGIYWGIVGLGIAVSVRAFMKWRPSAQRNAAIVIWLIHVFALFMLLL
ncbi:MAG: hypothetical protein ACR2GY_02570 [Phycisphaerales bacterium]